MKIFDELEIVWSTGEGQEFRPGIYFYGYLGNHDFPEDADSLKELWSHLDAETDLGLIDSAQGNFLCLTVWIKSWPDDASWWSAVKSTLSNMVTKGAHVAWCGGEPCSHSLEEIDRETTSGDIYAAFSKRTGLMPDSPSSDDVTFLSDDDVWLLKSALPC